MPVFDDLSDPYREIHDLQRRVRELERATPLNNASIGRGGLTVYGGGSITIDNNGGITITGPNGQIVGSGTIQWTGTFTNTGQTNLNGPTVVNGDATVVGPLHVNGATDINGTLAVKGATTLNNNLTVATGGGITIASTNALQLSPGGNHAIQWALGAYLISNDGGVGMGASGHSAAIQAQADGSAVLFYANGRVAVWSSSAGVTLYSPSGTKTMQLTDTGLVGP